MKHRITVYFIDKNYRSRTMRGHNLDKLIELGKKRRWHYVGFEIPGRNK